MRLYEATIVNRKNEEDRHRWFVVAKDVPEAIQKVMPQIQNVPDECYDLEDLRLLGKEGTNLIGAWGP